MDQGTEGINSKKAEVIDSLCQRASEYPERDQGKSFMWDGKRDMDGNRVVDSIMYACEGGGF